ncbi:MAG: ribosome small subunit-dependent GTPase A [Pseudanabaenaceae cyanobacterium SKYGB_i_bin29]|nr:ribosome small subunit-dependent GTPase A [Pseudanabaenaceae cyanobacterium SKYG29]MDW8420691.1 ribosome small subunit-dependent GTPase A [Pseudanabaenaceae cyanobacterium SKYGB_i_bin29]
MELTGQVFAVQANFYRVKLDEPCHNVDTLLCVRRARLKKIGQQVWVGDRVVITEPDWQGQRGAIAEVLPRRNYLERPGIANIDRVILMFSCQILDPVQISRFLVYSEYLQTEILLCLNKRDLIDDQTWQEWHDRLSSWGYEPLPLSVEQGEGIDCLEKRISKGVSILCGPSGVGKSSLIKYLLPQLPIGVGTVDPKLGRGRHTTRHVELFEVPGGGKLADSPGFIQPALPMGCRELGQCFPEIRRQLQDKQCEFSDCLHREEPGCQVSKDWERYEHYCQFLAEVQEQESRQAMTATPDDPLKVKKRSGGRTIVEPRLNPKKYRAVSRRQLVQSLEADLEGTGQP